MALFDPAGGEQDGCINSVFACRLIALLGDFGCFAVEILTLAIPVKTVQAVKLVGCHHQAGPARNLRTQCLRIGRLVGIGSVVGCLYALYCQILIRQRIAFINICDDFAYRRLIGCDRLFGMRRREQRGTRKHHAGRESRFHRISRLGRVLPRNAYRTYLQRL